MNKQCYAERREQVRRRMREAGFDALLVSHAANRYYLSGFELHDCQCNESSGRLIIMADGNDWLCTDARYLGTAQSLWDNNHIFIYGGNAAQAIGSLLKKIAKGKVGIESCCISLQFYHALCAEIAVEAADGLIEAQRLIKDADEIAALERSFAINHALMQWIPQQCVVGKSEKALSWEIEKFFREQGADELAFANIVAVGKNGALPHAIPSEAVVTDNCPVLVDVGCRAGGYCSDQTRSFWVGNSPSPEFERTLALVQEAQQAAMAIMRPNVPMRDAYHAARAVFEKAGVAHYFTHGLGHGVGLETHEAPSLNPRSQGILRQGMVVTVEPGLYYPEWGGVRWEYTVLITEDGVRIL